MILLRQRLPSPLAPLESRTHSKSSPLIWPCPPLFASSLLSLPGRPSVLWSRVWLLALCLRPRCGVVWPPLLFPPGLGDTFPPFGQCAGEDGTTQTVLYVDRWAGPALSNPPWLSPLYVVCTKLFHGYSVGGGVGGCFLFLFFETDREKV